MMGNSRQPDLSTLNRDPLYLLLPPLLPRWATRQRLLVGLAVAAMVAVGLLILNINPIAKSVFAAIYTFTLAIIAAVAVVSAQSERHRMHDFRATYNLAPGDPELQAEVEHERARQLLDGNVSQPLIENGWRDLVVTMVERRTLIARRDHGFWSWNTLDAERIRRGLPRAATIVANWLENEVRPLPRTGAMLEPEYIVASLPQSTKATMTSVAMFGLFALVQAANRNWLTAAFLGFGALGFLASMTSIRNSIPGLRPEGRAPIAGPGTIEDHSGKRWSVDAATMFIWSQKPRMPLYVYVCGPAGWITFTFSSSADPDFMNLWQRWTHPNPRPELLIEN